MVSKSEGKPLQISVALNIAISSIYIYNFAAISRAFEWKWYDFAFKHEYLTNFTSRQSLQNFKYFFYCMCNDTRKEGRTSEID